jgi:ribosomal protein S24E
LATTLRAPALWRGDIILTSMRLRLGKDGVFSTFEAAVGNTAINAMTMSLYSHAMLVVGQGRIIEFRMDLKEKSLRQGLTEGGKEKPAVAHVFRHKKSNGANRDRIIAEAYKNKSAFKSVDMDYVLRVWTGLNHVGWGGRREEVQGMMVCSTFCTSTYWKAGLPLRDGEPHNMTPGDISMCADVGSIAARGGGGLRDVWAQAHTAYMRGLTRVMRSEATLDFVGVISPSEYA